MIRWFLAAIFSVTLFSGPAMAQNHPVGFYIGAAVGPAFVADVDSSFGGQFGFDIAPFGSLYAGYRLRPNIRVEGELSYLVSDVDVRVDDLEVVRGSVSGYYDFDSTSFFRIPDVRPYAGVGVGIANVELDAQDVKEFSWHVEGGLSFAINETLDFVPGLRLEHTSLDEENGFDSDLWTTQLRAGLRYYF